MCIDHCRATYVDGSAVNSVSQGVACFSLACSVLVLLPKYPGQVKYGIHVWKELVPGADTGFSEGGGG